jgi:ATP-dependent helicase/nuclease subunit A
MARTSKSSPHGSQHESLFAQLEEAATVVSASPVPRWTAAQQAVIEHVEGDLLVSAAAGSGKTAVLAERCARLVTMDGPKRTDVDRLLVLTFTEAAAAEMRSRIAQAVRSKIFSMRGDGRSDKLRSDLFKQTALIDRASISTLHAFCARTLRNYFHDADLDPAFEILDEEEAGLWRDEILDDLLAGYHQLPETDPFAAAFTEFYEAYGQGRASAIKGFIRDVHAMLSSVKSPGDWLAAARDAYSPTDAPRVLDDYARRVADQLSLLHGSCARNITFLQNAGALTLAETLIGFRNMLATAISQLRQEPATWDSVAATINAFEFPKSKKPPEFDAETWKNHKAFTLEKLKAKLDSFKEFTFALPHGKLLADLQSLTRPLDVLLRMTLDFQAAYHDAKQKQSRLDFSDLERLTLNLLSKPDSPAREDLRLRYDHILVDEFQDINPLQAAVLDALRSPTKHNHMGNLFVVGDIKQSIYGFRLSDPSLFAALERQYKSRTTHTACINLQNNFRSLAPLLHNMNTLFSRLLTPSVAGVDYQQGHQLHPPELPAAEPLGPVSSFKPFTGTPVELHIALTDTPDDDSSHEAPHSDDANTAETAAMSAIEQEAQMVARLIVDLMQSHRSVTRKNGQPGPLRYADIAILLRGMKNRAHIFARALAQANIPVHADLSTGYFDAPEVRDTLSLLEILDNPLQDIPLVGAMLSPFGRFTHDDLARIRLAYPNKHETDFYRAVPQYQLDHAAAPDDADLIARLSTFFDTLSRYRALMRNHPLHEALAEIFQDSGIVTYVSGLTAGTQRVANLHMLHQRALQFSGFRKQGLHRFLKFIGRLRDADGDYGEAPVLSEASDVVRIMSIHKSKGLEFPVVFASSLGAKFNIQTTGPVIVHRDLHVALQVVDVERNISYHSAASKSAQQETARSTRAEELRLLYVALTRAREHLILTGATTQRTIDAARQRWADHGGPMPEDMLLDGRSYFDWLLPLAATGELGASWPDAPHAGPLSVTLHQRVANSAAAPPTDPAADLLIAKLLARQPTATAEPDTVVQSLIARLEARYKYEPLTTTPALLTVTGLKNRQDLAENPDEPGAKNILPTATAETLTKPVWLTTGDEKAVQPATARGIATHRFLQLLDFAAVQSRADLLLQRDAFIAQHKLIDAEAALINLDDIAWFLLDTPLGRQLQDASRSSVAAALGSSEVPSKPRASAAELRLLREISFNYALPPNEILPTSIAALDPTLIISLQDRAQLRGVIDVLLVSPTQAQIIDYKTDHPLAVAERLPAYQNQMRYYIRAATDILRRPVPLASLIFLSARRIEEVRNL